MEAESKVKSLVKAMRVLECFSIQTPEMGVSEVARKVGLQKSSVHNILRTFEQIGYITQNADTGRYNLGLELLKFSYIITSNMDIQKVLAPIIRQIARETGEVCYLAIPHGGNVLYIDSSAGDVRTPARAILGECAPMYCTGLGKAMLAYSPELMQLQPEPLTAFTPNTIVQKDALKADLEATFRRGFALDNMEHEFGVTCVAVPILGHGGQLMAAISISGPSLRFTEDRIPEIAEHMIRTSEPVQRRI